MQLRFDSTEKQHSQLRMKVKMEQRRTLSQISATMAQVNKLAEMTLAKLSEHKATDETFYLYYLAQLADAAVATGFSRCSRHAPTAFPIAYYMYTVGDARKSCSRDVLLCCSFVGASPSFVSSALYARESHDKYAPSHTTLVGEATITHSKSHDRYAPSPH
jgi:hypothetical protein